MRNVILLLWTQGCGLFGAIGMAAFAIMWGWPDWLVVTAVGAWVLGTCGVYGYVTVELDDYEHLRALGKE